MNHWDTSASVVVGVDGSVAALNAAKWAVAEAKSRGAPLRLVHVITPKRTPPRSRNDIRWAMKRGQDALQYAAAAIAEADNTVRVETEVRCGSPAEVLLDESYCAAMICIGTGGRRRAVLERQRLGPLAAALAEKAHCSVAIIRTEDDGVRIDTGVIAVVLDDQPDNDEVVHQAMKEGRLRKATVRQIDRRLNSWVRRYADVHVETVAYGTGRGCSEGGGATADLAVVGRADAEKIAQLVTPNCHPIPGYPDCSVLLVRN
jgi:nucleotide-binding universal stress UspA family protein